MCAFQCGQEAFIGCTCEADDHGLCYDHKDETCPIDPFYPYAGL